LLAMLAGGMALIFTVARRAERLAKLQLQFVAGVSHELCTPLAVINSAAENLADGVVDGPQQMREYGGMIREQGRRLERMVDEVLLFAAGKFDRAGFELGPVEIARVVRQSLDFSEPMLRAAGFAVEKEISADLPLVVADPGAVTKCVENLVSNAVKYSGDKRWLAVRARVAAAEPQPEVQVSVEDKGMGIAATDLANIFEPFYRVQSVREGQIRGVGLGLYLVKRLMGAWAGALAFRASWGEGLFFLCIFRSRIPPNAEGREARFCAARKAIH
jgi:signal transduction histidine kinase